MMFETLSKDIFEKLKTMLEYYTRHVAFLAYFG